MEVRGGALDFLGLDSSVRQGRGAISAIAKTGSVFGTAKRDIESAVLRDRADSSSSAHSSIVTAMNKLRTGANDAVGRAVDRIVDDFLVNIEREIKSAGGVAKVSKRQYSNILNDAQERLVRVSARGGGVYGGDVIARNAALVGSVSADVRRNGLHSATGLARKLQYSSIEAAGSFDISRQGAIIRKNIATALRNNKGLPDALKQSLMGIRSQLGREMSSAPSDEARIAAIANAKMRLDNAKVSFARDPAAKQLIDTISKGIAMPDKKSLAKTEMKVVGAKLTTGMNMLTKGLGRAVSVFGVVGKAFTIGVGAFQKANSVVNAFGRQQIAVLKERGSFGRMISGSGINPRELMTALHAGRRAGMDDATIISQQVSLQRELANARWGESKLTESVGRWGGTTYNADGTVKSQHEMMLEFSRILNSLGSKTEKLQFLGHIGYRPEQMEMIANYEKLAERNERVRKNERLQGTLERANILDETGYYARADAATKIEYRRREILNQNAMDEGPWAYMKRMLHPDNSLFADFTARQHGVAVAKSDAAMEALSKELKDLTLEVRKNGGVVGKGSLTGEGKETNLTNAQLRALSTASGWAEASKKNLGDKSPIHILEKALGRKGRWSEGENRAGERKLGRQIGAGLGGGLGAWAGAKTGAAIGTFLGGPVGTVVGGVVGGVGGWVLGTQYGGDAGEEFIKPGLFGDFGKSDRGYEWGLGGMSKGSANWAAAGEKHLGGIGKFFGGIAGGIVGLFGGAGANDENVLDELYTAAKEGKFEELNALKKKYGVENLTRGQILDKDFDMETLEGAQVANIVKKATELTGGKEVDISQVAADPYLKTMTKNLKPGSKAYLDQVINAVARTADPTIGIGGAIHKTLSDWSPSDDPEFSGRLKELEKENLNKGMIGTKAYVEAEKQASREARERHYARFAEGSGASIVDDLVKAEQDSVTQDYDTYGRAGEARKKLLDMYNHSKSTNPIAALMSLDEWIDKRVTFGDGGVAMQMKAIRDAETKLGVRFNRDTGEIEGYREGISRDEFASMRGKGGSREEQEDRAYAQLINYGTGKGHTLQDNIKFETWSGHIKEKKIAKSLAGLDTEENNLDDASLVSLLAVQNATSEDEIKNNILTRENYDSLVAKISAGEKLSNSDARKVRIYESSKAFKEALEGAAAKEDAASKDEQGRKDTIATALEFQKLVGGVNKRKVLDKAGGMNAAERDRLEELRSERLALANKGGVLSEEDEKELIGLEERANLEDGGTVDRKKLIRLVSAYGEDINGGYFSADEVAAFNKEKAEEKERFLSSGGTEAQYKTFQLLQRKSLLGEQISEREQAFVSDTEKRIEAEGKKKKKKVLPGLHAQEEDIDKKFSGLKEQGEAFEAGMDERAKGVSAADVGTFREIKDLKKSGMSDKEIRKRYGNKLDQYNKLKKSGKMPDLSVFRPDPKNVVEGFGGAGRGKGGGRKAIMKREAAEKAYREMAEANIGKASIDRKREELGEAGKNMSDDDIKKLLVDENVKERMAGYDAMYGTKGKKKSGGGGAASVPTIPSSSSAGEQAAAPISDIVKAAGKGAPSTMAAVAEKAETAETAAASGSSAKAKESAGGEAGGEVSVGNVTVNQTFNFKDQEGTPENLSRASREGAMQGVSEAVADAAPSQSKY